MLSNCALCSLTRFEDHHQPTAKRSERGFELFEADDVVAVEDMSDLLRGPAQPLGQLRLVEPGLAHRAVEFELCGRQSGKSHHCDARFGGCDGAAGNILVVGDHAEDRFVEHVLGLTQRLLEVAP